MPLHVNLWAEPSQPLDWQEKTEILKGLIPGMDKAVLRHPTCYHAEVLLYGGQVISWSSPREEFLFVSRKATFKPETVVRGGIPICFPKFSPHGTTATHGIVRDKIWEVDTSPNLEPSSTGLDTYIDLIHKSTTDTAGSSSSNSNWPHKFEFRLRVAVQLNRTLQLTSRIRNVNTDGKPFDFQFAYHTYLAVSDIGEVRIEGLETTDYLDNLKDKEQIIDGDALTFESEVDRVYLEAPKKIVVIDHEKQRSYEIRKDDGLPDILVWNPWDKKSKAMPDLEKNDYRKMVCVEPAIWQKPKTLKPGQEWKGIMEITVVRSSYHSKQDDH